jgi:NAD(P)-dependent dehydrogenase (short-subunit alcohol dehydrogenase family)
MDLGLNGKAVIVTGGAGGLGRQYAFAFAKEGAKLVVCDILDCAETANAIKAVGGEVLALKTDTTSESDTVEMAKRANEHFGSIDVLVNNAGIYGSLRRSGVDQMPVEEWDRVIASHGKGTFLCCKAVFPYMKDKGGKIINIASGAAFSGPATVSHYATAKGAVVSFSRSLTREFGPYNINVNVVAPGLILTQATLDFVSEEGREAYRQSSVLKRPQQPDSPVGTVLFLASRQADDITGQVIVVDGGGVFH